MNSYIELYHSAVEVLLGYIGCVAVVLLHTYQVKCDVYNLLLLCLSVGTRSDNGKIGVRWMCVCEHVLGMF